MIQTPKGMRLCIGIYGRRNVGKSSLLNAMTRQETSIVSEYAGTTTDPVEKAMELLPIGPVLWIDTAGVDDEGALGEMRIKRTEKIIERTDIALIVTDGVWGNFEERLHLIFKERNIPVVIVLNKCDLADVTVPQLPEGAAFVRFSAVNREGVTELVSALIANAPESFMTQRPILGDLVPPESLVLLVVPIDLEAPRGRLILPQVQTIRDVLDHHLQCIVTQDDNVRGALDKLKDPPALVVCDSQAFKQVAETVPNTVALTSFSILFARLKGDLRAFAKGAFAISNLKPGDTVLIAEACTHHPIGEDIGTVKIPRLLETKAGGKLDIRHVSGADFPTDLSPYKLVIHCGGCTFNPRQMLHRLWMCEQAGIPITNYGLAIAECVGILRRALGPFPEILAEVDA